MVFYFVVDMTVSILESEKEPVTANQEQAQSISMKTSLIIDRHRWDRSLLIAFNLNRIDPLYLVNQILKWVQSQPLD